MIDPAPLIKPKSHLLFVTGRLAKVSVEEIVKELAKTYEFEFTVAVMPITVAALITPRWLVRRLEVPEQVTDIVVPGYCEADVQTLRDHFAARVHLGPNDCRRLPEWFSGKETHANLDNFNIEIIAEINHAPRMPISKMLRIADQYVTDGADIIDVGGDPLSRCNDIGDRVRSLVDKGYRVSIDSFDPWEVGEAIKAGAELVLSVNSTNREVALDHPANYVVIPDTPTDLESLYSTIDYLVKHEIPMVVDPILEPIGAGLAPSIVRYHEIRQRYPEQPMMMGIGNLTELTDVDSAGMNMLLLGICEELRIEFVLTTQVINWARSSVKECDHARRLVAHAVAAGTPPKRLSDALVMLRDPKLRPISDRVLKSLAEEIKDNNYRLFARPDGIHLLSAGLHLSDEDPFRLFESLLREPQSDNVDPAHAFYLGYEMAKASLAIQLGKQYEQDRALRFGMLTVEEDLHRVKRTSRHRRKKEIVDEQGPKGDADQESKSDQTRESDDQ
ncbi:MAG: DUF6513 domain-containing protein [Planctomycetota bacterium]